MKIVYKKQYDIPLCEIKAGECFSDCYSEDVYVKLELDDYTYEILRILEQEDDATDSVVAVFNLRTNLIEGFNSNKKVARVNAELVIN